MTFLSYAQNFEDVMLWRALKHIPAGFYIDVGAMDPEEDSVTRAFYERGWHGINIEPSPEHFARFSARQRDVNLQVALGDAASRRTLFVIPGTGLSTLNDKVANAHNIRGYAGRETLVEVTTLAGVCQQYAQGDIHFLKIDVEGAEQEVLAGADFSAYRPWIVVVEATRPMSQEQEYAGWEPMLLDAGYKFVWFDGLNRFYLAAERYEELKRHFQVPPNIFDGFAQVAGALMAERIEHAQLIARTAETRAREMEAQSRASEELVASMRATLSWRLTAPFRSIGGYFQRFKRK